MTKMTDDKDRPPLEHTAWVFEKICDHLFEGGTFRYLIYDRMGYGPEAYTPLYRAGGIAISNAFSELKDYYENDELKKYKEFISKARAESKLCAIDGQHFVLVPYWFMRDIGDVNET